MQRQESVGLELSKEFEVKVGVYLLLLVFVIVVDMVMENEKWFDV